MITFAEKNIEILPKGRRTSVARISENFNLRRKLLNLRRKFTVFRPKIIKFTLKIKELLRTRSKTSVYAQVN